VSEEAAAAFSADDARRWSIGICAFTGAWGVLTGFAAYILVRTADFSDPWNYVIGVCVAAGASFIVEALRETVRGEIVPLPTRRIGQAVVTILTLLVFELFVLASHNAVDVFGNHEKVEHLRQDLLGPVLASSGDALRDLIVLAALWMIPGAAVGAFLGRFIVRERDDQTLRPRALLGAATGVLVAVLAAPVAVFSYVLVWRLVLALELVATAPAMWEVQYTQLMTITYGNGSSLVGLPAVVIGGGIFAMMGLMKLWLWSVAGKAIDAVLLAAVVVLGVRRHEWRPFGIVVAGFLIGVVAPLLGDVGAVFKLALLAAVVWVVPGLVLGLAAPLLDRPSERARWWSAIAVGLGLVTATLTALLWHSLGSHAVIAVVIALLFFLVALLFASFRDIQEFWPALALCLAAIATGLTFLLVTQTASFHGVLIEVRAINALPASIAPDEHIAHDEGDLRGVDSVWNLSSRALPAIRPPAAYAKALAGIATMSAADRAAIETPQRASLTALRARGIAQLQAVIASRPRDAALGDELRAPLELTTLSGAEFAAAVAREETAIRARLDLVSRERRAAFDLGRDARSDALSREEDQWSNYFATFDLAAVRVSAIDDVLADLTRIDTNAAQNAQRDDATAAAEHTFEAQGQPEVLEVSLAGAFAFWMTVGLLSAWALRRRITPESGAAAD
jgi:hypothetical protein